MPSEKRARLATACTFNAAGPAAARWYNGERDNPSALPAELDTRMTDASSSRTSTTPGATSPAHGATSTSAPTSKTAHTRSVPASPRPRGDAARRPSAWRRVVDVAQRRPRARLPRPHTLRGDPPDLPRPGEHMPAISPVGDGRAFLESTSGDNVYGSPINDARNWFHSDYFGSNCAENTLGILRFSESVAVPAPPTLVLLGLAALAARRRRRLRGSRPKAHACKWCFLCTLTPPAGCSRYPRCTSTTRRAVCARS